VHAAAQYAHDNGMYRADELPAGHATWRGYRDHLLATTPSQHSGRFTKRFARQASDEATARQQVKQLLANDWEGNLPILRPKAERLREVWWERL
jgi:predicted phosphoadenosine phosphosulfate sulfurtransferase